MQDSALLGGLGHLFRNHVLVSVLEPVVIKLLPLQRGRMVSRVIATVSLFAGRKGCHQLAERRISVVVNAKPRKTHVVISWPRHSGA